MPTVGATPISPISASPPASPASTAAPAVDAALPAASAPWLREDLIHPDPLLDCLVEVCRLNGRAASRASLSAGLPLAGDAPGGRGCMTLELAERAAARAGMSTKLLRLPLADIDTAALELQRVGQLQLLDHRCER